MKKNFGNLYENLGGTYHEKNGHLIPDVTLPEQTNYQIGKYGRMHLEYIKQHRRGRYTTLLTEGKLNARLHEIDLEANKMLDAIIPCLASERGIAMFDTACEVRRLKDNASDKFLEIVTPTDLRALLEMIPECQAVVTTGQKATDVIKEMFGCNEPSVGEKTDITDGDRKFRFWRMPSSSRAYPLSLEKKAEYYRRMFEEENIGKGH